MTLGCIGLKCYKIKKKKKRGKRCVHQLWTESTGVRSALCRWQKAFFKYLAFRVSIVDRKREQKVLLREDFTFPIFYSWKMEQLSGWVQTLGTKWLGVNGTLQGHRTLPATERITGQIQSRAQRASANSTSLQVNWCSIEAEMLRLFTKLQIYVKQNQLHLMPKLFQVLDDNVAKH